MNILILSQQHAERFTAPVPYVMISITGSTHRIANVPVGNDGCQEVLRLVFDDTGPGWARLEGETQLFTENDAQQIAQFVATWKDKVELVVVHCLAGISRSAGVAAAIAYCLNGREASKSIFNNPQYLPNDYVYSKLLNAMYDKGLCLHMNTPARTVR